MHFCGIVGGRGGNKFVPLGTATRAEVATVLQRYVKFVDGSEPKPEE